MNQTLQNPFPEDLAELVEGNWDTTLSNLVDPNNFEGYSMADFLQGNSTYINGK